MPWSPHLRGRNHSHGPFHSICKNPRCFLLGIGDVVTLDATCMYTAEYIDPISNNGEIAPVGTDSHRYHPHLGIAQPQIGCRHALGMLNATTHELIMRIDDTRHCGGCLYAMCDRCWIVHVGFSVMKSFSHPVARLKSVKAYRHSYTKNSYLGCHPMAPLCG
jgi:hypothetical protein